MRLAPGEPRDAAAVDAPWEALPDAQIVDGTPSTRFVDVDEGDGRVIGVWEHSPGVSTDVEADEVFVVLAGDATMEFVDPVLAPIHLAPGAIVRLTEGMRTVWTVRESLRKVYIAP